MSKPMTKNQIATIKANANGNETVLALIAEVERLQRLAKPNRKPKTRNVVRHVNTSSRVIYGGQYGTERFDNPNYGKVCPCKDCAAGIDKRTDVQRLTDKWLAEHDGKSGDYYDGRLGYSKVRAKKKLDRNPNL